MSSNVYTDFEIIEETRIQTVFILIYHYPNGIMERKQISIRLGDNFTQVMSIFYRDGEPVTSLPVAIGLAKQTDAAFVETDFDQRLIQLREHIRDDQLRTFVRLDEPYSVKEFKEIKSSSQPELLMITETDSDGLISYKFGYELE